MKAGHLFVLKTLIAMIIFGMGCSSNPTTPKVTRGDVISFNNSAGEEIGLLLDGRQFSAASEPIEINDLTITGPSTGIDIPEFEASSESNEIMAFTRGRPVALIPADWTTGDDHVVVDFPDLLRIPVTIWILKGPFLQQRRKVLIAVNITSDIWREERMGLEFSVVDIVDATMNPAASDYLTFVSSDCNDERIAADIGKAENQINVYYVETVDRGGTNGYACGNKIMMGEFSSPDLLAHEIGHSFGLRHIDSQNSFDQTNVMHSFSVTRRYLTEGQVLRAHLNPFSALNALYRIRAGLPTRDCEHRDQNFQCPGIAKRIWPDQNANAIFQKYQNDAAQFLLQDCFEPSVEPLFVGEKSKREAFLIRAFREGPEQNLLLQVKETAVYRYNRLQSMLSTDNTFGLNQSDVLSLRRLTRNDFIELHEVSFRKKYRTQALLGLEWVGGEKARILLEEILSDPSSPFSF